MSRILGDRYYTPQNIFNWLQLKLNIENQTIFDPCCGMEHPTLVAFQGDKNTIVENDIDSNTTAHHHLDATLPLSWEWFKRTEIDWTITNPPYKQPGLDAIVSQSIQNSKVGVAMLLRLSYYEPVDHRREILCKDQIPYFGKQLLAVYSCNPRPKFDPSKEGSDLATVAWFIWADPEVIQIPPFDFCVDWR